jgi:RimJ/RimL family protein N-acetyltransferase
MTIFNYHNICFRPLEIDDIELVRRMHNEPATLLQMGDPWPVSPLQQRDWFESMSRRRSDVTFMVCLIEDEKPIGVWRLKNMDAVNRVCEVGVDIFPDYRRQGYGYQTYRMIMAFLFDHYNVHMIYLRTAAFNQNAQSLYLELGFRETGRLVESIFRHGRYWDNVLMCLTVEDYCRLYSGSVQP